MGSAAGRPWTFSHMSGGRLRQSMGFSRCFTVAITDDNSGARMCCQYARKLSTSSSICTHTCRDTPTPTQCQRVLWGGGRVWW
jgi:hypothetical protein